MSSEKEFQHLRIPLQKLQSATNNFDKDSCIGRGGFGNVYKGEIRLSGELTMVAIKRLDRSRGQGTTEFWKEIMMLSQYKHTNLVSLLGFCDEGDEMLLVYEYLSKKSLNLHLSLPNLCWHTRLVICLGAAKGLAYLHEPTEGCQQRVLHRDIKSANILLDDNWQPKIADFGLSRLGPANQQITFVHSNVVGTKEYCDPLYEEEGFLTKESDVYSFGVVLFEVLCGKPAYVEIKYNHDIYRSLPWLARKCYEEKKLDTIIFTGIRETISLKSLEKFSAIAYQCLHKDRKERPSMAKIVKEIKIASLYQELKTNISLPEVALKEIEAATENFKMCIWENDQYQIYKGELSISGKPATTVFIKRFCESKGDMLRRFLAQIKILSPSPQPPNTMSLVGYCDGEKDKIIVHEYAERGSLDQYIRRRRSNNTTLTWLQRLAICCGAARGLDQFHERDIMHEAFQSTQILLDSKWVAKVAGFMISMPSSLTDVDVAAYSSPEYIASGKASKEADVYSLGMVLFEVLCGMLCTEAEEGYILSAKFLRELYEKKEVDKIVDPILREQNISVDRYSAIAHRCLLDDPKQRPSMGDVIQELEELMTIEVEYEKRVKKLQERAKAAEEREKVATEREKEMQAKMELIEKKLAVAAEREKEMQAKMEAAEREKKMQMELIEKEKTLRKEMEERMKKTCLFF